MRLARLRSVVGKRTDARDVGIRNDTPGLGVRGPGGLFIFTSRDPERE